jgi:excisionase family DNA binding protein
MGDVLTTHEVAELCDVHRATVVRWIKEGVLPAQQTLGGRYRVRRAELERLATERGLCIAEFDMPSVTSTGTTGADHLNEAVVLVVDDDLNMGALTTSTFEQAGISCTAVDTGYAGLDAVLKHRNIRVVILDLHLPGLDGLDTLVEMRRIRPDLKIIVASGSLRYFDVEQVSRFSDATIEKPFALDQLLRLCDSLLMGNAESASRTLARVG